MVDRIEGAVAVLVADDGAAPLDVPLALLPEGARAGAHLRVTREGASVRIALDEEAREAARSEVRALQERLRAKTRGGS